jgi:hypothetical protein
LATDTPGTNVCKQIERFSSSLHDRRIRFLAKSGSISVHYKQVDTNAEYPPQFGGVGRTLTFIFSLDGFDFVDFHQQMACSTPH